HDTERYYRQFERAVKQDPRKRFEKEEISDWLLKQKDRTSIFKDLVEKGKIPLRIAHNDPKISNILFKKGTDQVLAIIDWDTISRQLPILIEWGDMCRSVCSCFKQDEKGLIKIDFELDFFKSLAGNYLKTIKGLLNQTEKEYLFYAVEHVTFELSLRYYTDYLNGDLVFNIKDPKDNYYRALERFALYKSIKERKKEIKEIIQEILNRNGD
ncbi:MAG: phosphotransferase, partial [Candidatus Moranbacteria bacterium]|nr:phosphotransferase [Candidatus Moranbacteria bacterium]